MIESISISQTLRSQILAHACQCFPEEACGLIGGVNNEARQVWPVENELHSPVRFRMAPTSQLKVFLQMEENEVELLGIFHSHPTGPAIPSATDIAEFYYPGTPVLILSPAAASQSLDPRETSLRNEADWQINGFLIENDWFTEIELKIKF